MSSRPKQRHDVGGAMRNRMALSALGVGLVLLAGVAIGRYLLPRPTPTAPPVPSAPPTRFFASFDGLNAVQRHLTGVEPALISQSVGGKVCVDHGVYTRCYHCRYSYRNPGGYAEIKSAMQAIGNDIAELVAAEG